MLSNSNAITVPDPSVDDIRKWDRAFYLLLLCIMVWLIVSAMTNQGESGDGVQSVVNMRFLLGEAQFWYVQRGPLMTLILLPSEFVGQKLDLHPLDFRSLHLWVAFLHGFYLIGVWYLIRYILPLYGKARFLVFCGSVLCMVFMGYAMIVSPDILPGLFFLVMIVCFQRWVDTNQKCFLVLLSIFGVLVTFIKPTFCLFYISIYSYVCVALFFNRIRVLSYFFKPVTGQHWVAITAFSIGSGLVCWMGYALHVSLVPGQDIPFLINPVVFINTIVTQIPVERKNVIFPWYIYWVNLHNFGVSTLFLIGACLYRFGCSFRVKCNEVARVRRGSARSNNFFYFFNLAFCFAVLSCLSYREVRYLLPLTPLLALAIVPVAHKILNASLFCGIGRPILVLLLCFDAYRILPFVAAQLQLASRVNIRDFVQPMEQSKPNDRRVYISFVISFVVFDKSPIIGDRYHGIYHLSTEALHRLYGERHWVHGIRHGQMFEYDRLDVGDIVLWSNPVLARVPDYWRKTTPNLNGFIQFSGVVKEIELVRDKDFFLYQGDSGKALAVLSPQVGDMLISLDGSFSREKLLAWGLVGERDNVQAVKAIDLHVVCPKGLCQSLKRNP